MIATLTYNLPEDHSEFQTAVKATDLSLVIWDLDQWLRENYKYNKGDISVDSAEKVREKLREIMFEYSLSFESPIFM
jgi:hypothetical protein